ncbi:cysteine protease [Actinomyces viscosus]|nr:cysteine protease [Actinomyces viscosus]
MSSAGSSAPSWQGASAQAFSAAASSLSDELSGRAGELGRGAGVMDAYAGVLERAHGMAAELQAQAARLLVTSITSPATAPACQVAATVITTTFNALLSTVDLAATTAAASLATAASTGPRSGKNSEPSENKGSTPQLSREDKRRLREQADGNGDWDPDAHQTVIGDCYLLATLQGYSQTEDGQQFLRDQVRWDKGKNCFVVTLYDNGKPVYVDVDDYYSEGTKDDQGRPTLMSLYERAYGKHFGFQDLDDGGVAEEDAMEVSTGTDAYHVDTWGSEPGWFGWTFPIEDHKYDQGEWDTIKSAVDSGQVVVGTTTGGDFNNGNKVTAVTDTNRDGKIDATSAGGNDAQSDKEQELTISDHHSYTVEGIDDNYVTLRNPWGNNKHPDNVAEPGGLIRITREDYEKYFARTGISPVP